MRWKIVLLLLTVGLLGLSGIQESAVAQEIDTWWNVDYFDNDIFQAPAVVQGQVGELQFYWGDGSPESGVPVDNFTARYGADVVLPAGTYRFYALADDFVAVTVDFQSKIIDTFNLDRVKDVVTGEITLGAGEHHIQVDYREITGTAYLFLGFYNVASGTVTPSADALLNPTQYTNAEQTQYGTGATVIAGRLNVRDAPSVEGNVITVITAGTRYAVLGYNDDSTWVQLNIGGTPGWVNARFVNIRDGAAIGVDVDAEFSVVSLDDFATVRNTPNLNATNLSLFPKGAVALLIGRTQNKQWYQVVFNNFVGWVYAQSAALTPDVVIDDVPITG